MDREIAALLDLYRAGRFLDFEMQATRLLRVFPYAIAVHDILATAFLIQGRSEQAVIMYRQAVAIAPEIAKLHNGLALACLRLGKAMEAIASCRRALEISPGLWEARSNLGDAFRVLEQHEDAIPQYRKALEAAPHDAHMHSNLGSALECLNRLEEAVLSYRSALEIQPDRVDTHCNLGNTLFRLGRIAEAITSYMLALALRSDIADVHCNLATALVTSGELDRAARSCSRALTLNPKDPQSHMALGSVLHGLGRFEEAAAAYKGAGIRVALGRELECLYAANQNVAYAQRLAEISKSDSTNSGIAAIAAFVSQQTGSRSVYPFCRDPLKFVLVRNVKADLMPFEGYVNNLTAEIARIPWVWEPGGRSTTGGSQTLGNLFDIGTQNLTLLKAVILRNVESYFEAYAGEEDGFISDRPKRFSLVGWCVKLARQGKQRPHIHEAAWLSGVFYLRLPKTLANEEGAIKFGLHGHDYPVRNADIPTRCHLPSEGDLALFPSCLFHQTIPFSSDEERISVAFDLLPVRP